MSITSSFLFMRKVVCLIILQTYFICSINLSQPTYAPHKALQTAFVDEKEKKENSLKKCRDVKSQMDRNGCV